MIKHYGKLSAICLFVVLQCFAPLLHAHFDVQTHGFSGAHQHAAVELYCLDGDIAHCPEARIEALDTQAVTVTLNLAKKLSDPCDSIPPADRLSSALAPADLAAVFPPSRATLRWHFALPPAHAPPYTL